MELTKQEKRSEKSIHAFTDTDGVFFVNTNNNHLSHFLTTKNIT
jgi:hypothetical protein